MSTTMRERTEVAAGPEASFTQGKFVIIDAGKHSIGIIRLRSGELRAVRNWCPHKGAPICRRLHDRRRNQPVARSPACTWRTRSRPSAAVIWSARRWFRGTNTSPRSAPPWPPGRTRLCLLNVVQGGKTPELSLLDAEAMGYRLAIYQARC